MPCRCDFLALMNQAALHMHNIALPYQYFIFAILMLHLSGRLIAVMMAVQDAQMCRGCNASTPGKLDLE